MSESLPLPTQPLVGSNSGSYEIKVNGVNVISGVSNPPPTTITVGSDVAVTDLKGGISYTSTHLTSADVIYNVLPTDYLISIENVSYTSVVLPLITSYKSRNLAVVLNATPANVTITPTAPNTIEGIGSIGLNVLGQHIQLLADGDSKWYIM